MSARVPKVRIGGFGGDGNENMPTPARDTPNAGGGDTQAEPRLGVRAPVGVVKPRSVSKNSGSRITDGDKGAQATEESHTKKKLEPLTDQAMTPRLVQARKGTILEIFGSQKNIDVQAQSEPKKGWLSLYQKLMWNKKYFVIIDGFLFYFSKENYDLTRPDGVLHLANCDVVDCGTSKRFSFAINCPNGDGLTLLGETPNDVWEWMSAIYLASKVSTKACLQAELAKEAMEEHSRRLQMLSQQLVRTMDVELKSIHSQVRLLKQETKRALDQLKGEMNERLTALSSAFDQMEAAAEQNKNAKASGQPLAHNPVVDQIIVIAMRSLEAQLGSLRDECGNLKTHTKADLRRIKEEYEAQVFDLATQLAQASKDGGRLLSVRGEDDGEEGAKKSSLARAAVELRELAQLLQPIIAKDTAKDSELDSTLSAAVRSKLVPVLKDLPTVSDLVKQVEDERVSNGKRRDLLEQEIRILKERLDVAELDKSALAAEGQQAYEMLTHIEEQLYTEQTKGGTVFENEDPTHVKVYKVMNAFARSMALVAQVEHQLFTLTQRSKQTLTTRRDVDDEDY